MVKGRTKGAKEVDMSKKARISRNYQAAGGKKTRGAAAATARKHGLCPKNGPTQVKKWDAKIRENVASRSNLRNAGRPKGLTPEVEQKIADIFDDNDTQTYRKAAERPGLPKTTLHK
jgi:hypothetical protein